MAHNPKTSAAARSASLDAALNSATKFRIYSGTQPTDADTALGAQVMLVDMTVTWSAAAAGSKSATIASAVASVSGTASWGSFLTAGDVRVHDCTVGVGSSFDVNIDSTTVVIGELVAVSSATVSMAA